MEPRTCPHATCGHTWTPRKENPKKCPQCQNPLWRSSSPKKQRVSTEEMSPSKPGKANVPIKSMGAERTDSPLPWEPECVRAPDEKDSLSSAKAKAEELMRQLCQ